MKKILNKTFAIAIVLTGVAIGAASIVLLLGVAIKITCDLFMIGFSLW